MTRDQLDVLLRKNAFDWRGVAEELFEMVTILENGGTIKHLTEDERQGKVIQKLQYERGIR